MAPRYSVGIDLGTTNSLLASVDLTDDLGSPTVHLIPQWVAIDTTEARPALPSFLYLPAVSHGIHQVELRPDWETTRDVVGGEFARQQGAAEPERTVAAAKSWLAHHGVDRHKAILPWNASPEIPKISPVTAAEHYLRHIRRVWDNDHPSAQLAEQIVVLTVPASFDASARELTRTAAEQAGLPNALILLEEPQAAVYAWLAEHPNWREQVAQNDQLLVCDVGGGTTDFSLMQVTEQDGQLELERLGVGNHLLVGGDNMDLLLAHLVAERLSQEGTDLDPWQSVSLWHACRAGKEALLAPEGPEQYSIAILGRGSRLLGGTVTQEITRDEIARHLVDGFFPKCELSDRPERPRPSGFIELGLPFESDTSITRHLARFLSDQQADATGPTWVLFNGGVFQAEPFRERVLQTLATWFPSRPPQNLAPEAQLDHAVARGAAYYGWTKDRGGIRIRGGTARSYYVGIESAGLAIPGAPRPLHALCVAPFGMEEGTEVDVPSHEIGVVLGEMAEFRFFSSATRKTDQPGELITRWAPGEITETTSVSTQLPRPADRDDPLVPVRFHSHITELGMLELWCVESREVGEPDSDSRHRWKLEFNVRESLSTESAVNR